MGAPQLNTDARSNASKTKLRLLCYDPKSGGKASLVLEARTILGALRQLAGIEYKNESLLNMLATTAGRYHAALSLGPLLCLYWPKLLLDTPAARAIQEFETDTAVNIASKFLEDEEKKRDAQLHVALQIGKIVYLAPGQETFVDDPRMVWRSGMHVRARHGGHIPREREPGAAQQHALEQERIRKLQAGLAVGAGKDSDSQQLTLTDGGESKLTEGSSLEAAKLLEESVESVDGDWNSAGPWPDAYKVGTKIPALPKDAKTAVQQFVQLVFSFEVDPALAEEDALERQREDARVRDKRDTERAGRLARRKAAADRVRTLPPLLLLLLLTLSLCGALVGNVWACRLVAL